MLGALFHSAVNDGSHNETYHGEKEAGATSLQLLGRSSHIVGGGYNMHAWQCPDPSRAGPSDPATTQDESNEGAGGRCYPPIRCAGFRLPTMLQYLVARRYCLHVLSLLRQAFWGFRALWGACLSGNCQVEGCTGDFWDGEEAKDMPLSSIRSNGIATKKRCEGE
jgi:hypothetical protein